MGYELQGVILGLSNVTVLNWIKQFGNSIKEYVLELYIHAAQIGEDPNKRDYVVSNKMIESLGWSPDYTLDYGIQELINGYNLQAQQFY